MLENCPKNFSDARSSGVQGPALHPGSHDEQNANGREALARRLRWHLPQVNRVLDPRHTSRMEHVEAALAALGRRLIINVAHAM